MEVFLRSGWSHAYMIRKAIFAMMDIDEEKRPWAAGGFVGGWVVLSLLCSLCRKEFISSAEILTGHRYHVILPALLSLAEVLACVTAIKVQNVKAEFSHKEAASVIIFAHYGGTFLADFWFQFSEPQYSMLAGYVEPVLALCLLYICTGQRPLPAICISLMAVSLGAVFMTLNIQTVLGTNRSSFIKGLSVFFFCLRNICVTHLHEDYVDIKLRSKLTLSILFILGIMGMVVLVNSLPHMWVIPIAWACCGCVLHVCFIYLTTAVLLKKVSVTTLALLSVLAQVVENQLLLTFTPEASVESKPLLVTSHFKPELFQIFCGVVLITGGQYLYSRISLEAKPVLPSHKTVDTNEMYTRMEFLLFTASVFGIVFCVLQPRVSERDLNTLSLVGLDRIMRRLLEMTEGAHR